MNDRVTVTSRASVVRSASTRLRAMYAAQTTTENLRLLSVVMPAYNEENTIAEIIGQVANVSGVLWRC